MRVDFHASWPQYLEHLAPVYRALDDEVRGRFFVPQGFVSHAKLCGVDAEVGAPDPLGGPPVVVAGNGDIPRRHDAIYVAHGIGQQYGNSHASYAGGRKRDGIGLFLHCNERAAARERGAYPNAEVRAIGSPMMDAWHRKTKARIRTGRVAISFHWDGHQISPEASTSFPHFRSALADLASRFDLLGHGHPRILPELAVAYTELGIPIVRDFAQVLARADAYVCDNSSTLYEFASTNRPVVVLNAPWYRRDADHGLRFWEFADVGLNCDEPSELADTIEAALEDPPGVRKRRAEICDQVFAARDGHAADRAARAIEEFACHRSQRSTNSPTP